jgi:hypothetical protein
MPGVPMASTTPSATLIQAIEEHDCDPLQAVPSTSGVSTRSPGSPTLEQGIVSVRAQAAVARALIDELEQLLPGPHGGAVRSQVVEELTRLGLGLLQVARRLETAPPRTR